MIVLGAVLLVLAALVTVGTVFTNGDQLSDASLFFVSLKNVSAGGFFLTGVVVGIVGMFGLSLLLSGGARKRRKAAERKRSVTEVRGQAESLEQENVRLREELETTRSADVYPDTGKRV